MFIKEEKIVKQYTRVSKLGNIHAYKRTVTFIQLQCDSCAGTFYREKSQIAKKRCSNKYFHCCSNCDSKRFAQLKGVEKRGIWNMPVSSTIPIDKL